MKNENGFTFVELMIAVSLMSLVFLVVYSVFFTQFKLFNNQNSELDLVSDSNKAMFEIQEVINCYSKLDVPSLRRIVSDSTIVIDTADDGVNEGTELNVDGGVLYDKDMFPICKHVEDIIFVKGKDASRNIPVAENTVLIKISLRDGQVSYFLDGGIYLEK